MEKTTSRTLLIIEDQGIARSTMRRNLEYYGYAILEATGGAEGLRTFQKEREKIDLVLLDLSLPGVSGERMLAALRTLDPQVKVILCTEDPPSELRQRRGFQGACGVLRKPLSTQRLLAAVRRGLTP